MRIAIFNTLYTPYHQGGAEISVQLLAEELVKQGHQVMVVSTASEDNSNIINDVQVEYINTNNLYSLSEGSRVGILKVLWHFVDVFNPFYIFKVRNLIKAFKPDIIHTNNLSGFSPIIWGALKGYYGRIVHTVRDYYLLCPKSTMFKNETNCQKQCFSCKLLSLPKKRMSSKLKFVVGISDFILQKHLSMNYFNNAICEVIYNPIGSIEKPRRISKSKVVFGFMGRLENSKGIKFLLHTMKNLHNNEKWELVIAGDGKRDFVNELHEQFAKENIIFTGKLSPEVFFKKIDCLIFPSQWQEPFGRVIIEAYSYNIPVIANSVGGVPEIIASSKHMFSTENELIDRILEVIEGEIHIDKFDLEDFEIDKVASKYSKFYSTMIS